MRNRLDGDDSAGHGALSVDVNSSETKGRCFWSVGHIVRTVHARFLASLSTRLASQHRLDLLFCRFKFSETRNAEIAHTQCAQASQFCAIWRLRGRCAYYAVVQFRHRLSEAGEATVRLALLPGKTCRCSFERVTTLTVCDRHRQLRACTVASFSVSSDQNFDDLQQESRKYLGHFERHLHSELKWKKKKKKKSKKNRSSM